MLEAGKAFRFARELPRINAQSLENGTLTFEVYMSAMEPPPPPPPPPTSPPAQLDESPSARRRGGVKTLGDDLACLFNSKEDSDVTIQVGSQKFYVLSYILKARIPTLHAMFRRSGSDLQLNNVEPDVLSALLEFA